MNPNDRRVPPTRWRLRCRGAAAVLALAWGLLACQSQATNGGPMNGPTRGPAPGSTPATVPSTPVASGPSIASETEAGLLDRIRDEIGAAACRSNDECRSLPVGAKACGGPAAWWPWSTAQSDGKQLQAWAQDLERLQRERIARSGQLSNCQFVADPGAACVAQRCVLQGRGRAV
jgi:hypothetical protein